MVNEQLRISAALEMFFILNSYRGWHITLCSCNVGTIEQKWLQVYIHLFSSRFVVGSYPSKYV